MSGENVQVKREVDPVNEKEMVDLEDIRKKKFFDKHPPLDDEQVEEVKEDSRRAKKKYSKDLQRVEDNLLRSLNMEFPIIDPTIDEAIAWIKQIPYWKLVQSIPEELQDSNIPQDERERMVLENQDYQMKTYELMAEAITIPKHNMEWWRDNATPRFMLLFEDALNRMYQQMEQETDFF